MVTVQSYSVILGLSLSRMTALSGQLLDLASHGLKLGMSTLTAASPGLPEGTLMYKGSCLQQPQWHQLVIKQAARLNNISRTPRHEQ